MCEQWDAEQVVAYLKGKLESQRILRNVRQTELKCLTEEINNLEDMIFTIERHTEKTSE